MERRKFFNRLGVASLATYTVSPVIANDLETKGNNSTGMALKSGEIQHMVIFDLKHEKGSLAGAKFLSDGQQILSQIQEVKNFQVFDQVSLKNDYTYGFSMVFADKTAYESYNIHPDHLAFVESRWKKEVTRFLEIDFKSH